MVEVETTWRIGEWVICVLNRAVVNDYTLLVQV
jgi:hypothetical protein